MPRHSSHQKSSFTLAHLAHDATAFVQFQEGQGWQGSRGNSHWRDASTESAQVTLATVLHAAHVMRYDIPDALDVRAGQLFFRHGVLTEVRLSGMYITSPADATPPSSVWSTPTPPSVQEGTDGTLHVHLDDVDRKYLAVLVQVSETLPSPRVVVCRWELAGEMFVPGSDEMSPYSLPKQPAVPPAFPDSRGRLPNNPLIAAGMAALWKGGSKARILVAGWQESAAGRPVYQHTGRHGGRILVYPNTGHSAAAPLPTTATLWHLVEHCNPFTADVALAVLAQLCEPSSGSRPQAPLLESVRITADAILRYKGIQRWGFERRQLHERVFEEMERLQAFQFDVEKYPERDLTTGKWDPHGVSWHGDRFFDIVKVELYQESLFGDRERIEVSWLVRAGQWARWWFNAQGRVWIGHMARALLELDHRETRRGAVMAKKIGQRMVLLSEALHIGDPITRRIDRLLEDIGELPTPEERNRNWLGRTRKSFEVGLHILQEAHVLTTEWPEAYGGIPNRLWLQTSLCFTLPKYLPTPAQLAQAPGRSHEPHAHIRRRKPRRHTRTAKPQGIKGVMIRHMRLERHWSQRTLASHLGITRPYLSQIENDARLPSKCLGAKIEQWLQESQET